LSSKKSLPIPHIARSVIC